MTNLLMPFVFKRKNNFFAQIKLIYELISQKKIYASRDKSTKSNSYVGDRILRQSVILLSLACVC